MSETGHGHRKDWSMTLSMSMAGKQFMQLTILVNFYFANFTPLQNQFSNYSSNFLHDLQTFPALSSSFKFVQVLDCACAAWTVLQASSMDVHHHHYSCN